MTDSNPENDKGLHRPASAAWCRYLSLGAIRKDILHQFEKCPDKDERWCLLHDYRVAQRQEAEAFERFMTIRGGKPGSEAGS